MISHNTPRSRCFTKAASSSVVILEAKDKQLLRSPYSSPIPEIQWDLDAAMTASLTQAVKNAIVLETGMTPRGCGRNVSNL
jgi:hypothetical protein